MPALFSLPFAQLSTVPRSSFALAVQKLPSSPILEKLAFEQPWLSMVVFVAMGLVAKWFFSRQNQPRRGYLALGACLAFAAANFLLSMLVTTTRERLATLTRQTINQVVTGDAASLGPMLRSDLVVLPFGLNRDRVLEQVAVSMRGQYAVKDPSILELLVVQDSADAARSQFHLRVTPTQQMYGVPAASWWMLTWQRDPATGNWLISRIECQQIDGVSNIDGIRP